MQTKYAHILGGRAERRRQEFSREKLISQNHNPYPIQTREKKKLFFGIIYRFMLAYHVSHFADKKRMKEKPHCQSTSNNSHIFSPKHIYIEFLTSPFQLSEISMLTSFVAFCVASSLCFWKPNCRKNYFPFDFSWCVFICWYYGNVHSDDRTRVNS